MSDTVNVDFVTKVVEVEVNDTQAESLAAAAAVASAGTAAEKATAAAISATNAANSYNSANTVATALTDIYNEAIEQGTVVAPAVDSALSVSGAAADAQVAGNKFAGLNDNFYDYVKLSNVHYDADYVRGSLTNDGAVYSNYQYRVVTEDVQNNTENLIIESINTGFMIVLKIFTDSTASSVESSANIKPENCPYLIPANSYFRFYIRRITENNSEVADVNYFKRQVNVDAYDILDEATPKLDAYYYDTFTSQYMSTSTNKITDSDGASLSGWIKVKTGDVICYKLASSSASYLFVLCSCKMFTTDTILYSVPGTGAQNYVDGTYTVTQDGYIRYGFKTSNKTNCYFYVKGALQTESAIRLSALEDEVNFPVPSYWESAISTSEARYDTVAKTMSDNVVAFPFITDVHWGNNAQQSPRLLHRICTDLGLKQIVVGGDIEMGHETTADAATAIERDFFQHLNTTTVVNTIGNHDNNSDQNADASLIIDNGTLYNTFCRKWEQEVICDGVHNSYYDFPSHKLRIVTLDSGTPCWYKGSGQGSTYDGEQMNAACDQALARIAELPAGWSVIIVTHIIWSGAEAGSTPSFFTFVTDRIKTRILDQEFSAEIIAILAGHLHRDIDGTITSTDGNTSVLAIGTSTDNYNMSARWGGPTMTAGTDTEQAFDIFQIDLDNRTIYTTRVGAGSNRNWSY